MRTAMARGNQPVSRQLAFWRLSVPRASGALPPDLACRETADPMPANQYPALSARNDGALWRVTPSTATESGLGEADRALAEAAINDLLARQEARLAPFHLAWRQELPFTTYR